MNKLWKDFSAPQPIARLAFLRVFLPLAILGFMALRIAHPADWLSSQGFQIPRLEGKDYRQPLYLPPLPLWGAYALSALLAVSGLLTAAGWRTRLCSGLFAVTLAYVAFADRLEAFTVSKLGPPLALALCLAPSAAAFSLDAPRDPRGRLGITHVTWGNVRFFQLLIVALYMSSGFAKARGDWLHNPYVLWTHLHDSYQTAFSYHFARLMPAAAWPVIQALVLAFETGAPLWFALPWTRKPALAFGLGMHAFIGLGFGPVKWFALLMGVLLLGCFAPMPWLEAALAIPARLRARLRKPADKPGNPQATVTRK